jgi:glycosyltransferase involved in cell wall biosynthesis
MKNKFKTALVHDWLTGMRGGERVLEAIYELYPSPVYTLVHTKNFKSDIIDNSRIITSSIQKIPFSGKFYRKLPAFFPRAIEEFDLSAFDVVLSSSHAAAKGVLTHSNQLHICYMHTPMRYAWDLYFQYLREAGLEKGPLGWYARKTLHHIRTWDIISSNRVDYFIANSRYIAARIKKIYNRDADVIYPPVDTDYFNLSEKKEDFYLTASQITPYKKIDLIVEAFRKLPDRKLLVIGDGPELKKVKKAAAGSNNIELLGYQPHEMLKHYMQKARAFVFAAEEDFGIIPVEAQACGTPVIAYGRGGVRETVIDKETGVFFDKQEVPSLVEAVVRFEKLENRMSHKKIRRHAEEFSRERFQKQYQNYVEKKYELFLKREQI